MHPQGALRPMRSKLDKLIGRECIGMNMKRLIEDSKPLPGGVAC